MTERRVLVIGESLIDVVGPADSQRRHAGGSPMNVAYGLGRLGIRAELLTRIGDDEDGRLIRNHLASAGVALRHGSVGGGPTSTATAVLDAAGAASYRFALDSSLPEPGSLDGVAVLHAGSIGAVAEPGAAQVRALFGDRSARTLRSYDPNIRPAVMPDRQTMRRAVERFARGSDIVKLSDEDAAWLYPGRALNDLAAEYIDLGAAIVAITRGRDGCLLRSGGRELELAAPPTTVVDTIGAGDSFMSGMLFAIVARGLETDVLERRQAPDLLEYIGLVASSCAAITVSRAGANPPTLDELSALLNR